MLGKLLFARKRLDEIAHLVSSSTISVDADLRQQLAQEFFFHLLGSVEYLAQLINKNLNLGLNASEVSAHKVSRKLKNITPNNPLIPILDSLSADTKREPFPTNPFSDRGYIYRLINYRNEVVHRNSNPYHFSLHSGPAFAEFWLDPRDHSKGKTGVCVDIDLVNMFNFVNQKVQAALPHV